MALVVDFTCQVMSGAPRASATSKASCVLPVPGSPLIRRGRSSVIAALTAILRSSVATYLSVPSKRFELIGLSSWKWLNRHGRGRSAASHGLGWRVVRARSLCRLALRGRIERRVLPARKRFTREFDKVMSHKTDMDEFFDLSGTQKRHCRIPEDAPVTRKSAHTHENPGKQPHAVGDVGERGALTT